MGIIKKYKALLILVPVVIVGFFFYHNDVKALEKFVASYEKFDKAISDFSKPVFVSNVEGAPATDDLERKADEALAELNTKTSVRISSLIKNDAELMNTELEIADFSGKELDNLKAYKRAVADKNVDLGRLAKEFGDLANKRQTAYARFRELGGLND